ncbi:MAG: BBP7 family outer membrane beta-barrel protein [Thermoguttaceae bacterium]
MPLSWMKLLQTSVIACCAVLTPLSASAQLSGGRLFTPMTDLEKPQGQGLYASLEAIYWTVSAPKDHQIGYETANGDSGVREVYQGGQEVFQHNTLDTSYLKDVFSLGTRIEIGNVRDHHGWLISGYGLPGQSTSMDATGSIDMVINDRVSSWDVLGSSSGHQGGSGAMYQATMWWDPRGEYTGAEGTNGKWYPVSGYSNLMTGYTLYPYTGSASANYPYDLSAFDEPILFTVPRPVGFLWGWVPIAGGSFTHDHVVDPTPDPTTGLPSYASRTHDYNTYAIVPLPITFDNISVNNKTDNWSLEAMYTYRTHPTRWGVFDFLAGVRYWQLNDKFSLAADGSRIMPEPSGTGIRPLSVLTSTSINSEAFNRIVGPQFGIRYSRTSSRYTFGLEGRCFTGVNLLTMRNNGMLSSVSNDPGLLAMTNAIGQTYAGMPLGLSGGANTFNYRKTTQHFTPGFELRANAHWQLTRQVGLQVGITSLWVDQLVRGPAVNDYSVAEDGRFFTIRDDKRSKSSVWVYGLTVGLVCNRF